MPTLEHNKLYCALTHMNPKGKFAWVTKSIK